MLIRLLFICGFVGSLTSNSQGVAIITYESYDDLTPATPDIVLGAPGSGGDSATINIWIATTQGQQWRMGTGSYAFEGVDHGDGSVTSPDGGITSSDHHWADMFQDPSIWFTVDALPNPQTVKFFPPGVPIPADGLYLGSLTVSSNELGTWTQPTNPRHFLVSDPGPPPPLDEGSDFFTVTVIPEPAAGGLLGVGVLMLLWRRTPSHIPGIGVQ